MKLRIGKALVSQGKNVQETGNKEPKQELCTLKNTNNTFSKTPTHTKACHYLTQN